MHCAYASLDSKTSDVIRFGQPLERYKGAMLPAATITRARLLTRCMDTLKMYSEGSATIITLFRFFKPDAEIGLRL